MKTKNNVQKTVLRSGAVILSLVLLSFTVAAQGYWKELLTNDSFTQIASALVGHRSSSAAPIHNAERMPFYAIATPIETVYETPLNYESWMAGNETFWINSPSSVEAFEPHLGLESWMVDANLFKTSETVAEKPLQVEAWMVSGSLWE